MRAPKQETVTFTQPADAVFEAVLGVAQNNKAMSVLAVHNGGRKLFVREKPKMSNAKFVQAWAIEKGTGTELHLIVGTDPRTPKALLDGRANGKLMQNVLEGINGALDGSAPAPVTPVSNHYLQKKVEIPWDDSDQDPEIELDGNIRAAYGL